MKTITIFTVVADTKAAGAAGDGTQVFRFRSRVEADRFAARATLYGRPAPVTEENVPRHLAQRWGVA